jgi:hypothetical protein
MSGEVGITVDHVTQPFRTAVSAAKDLFLAANVRRVIVRNSSGNIFLEVPMTVAAVVTIAVPVITGFGAIAALILRYSLAIEKRPTDSRHQSLQKGREKRAF